MPDALIHPSSAIITKQLTQKCKLLGKVIKEAGPYTLIAESEQSPFEALARSIVYQQLTGKAAATIHARLIALFAPAPTLEPRLIVAAQDDFLRSAGLSRAKTAALKDLASKTLEGLVPAQNSDLKHLSDAEIVSLLTQIRGIGKWTVEMFLMFTLGRLDVFPSSDLGVRQGFSYVYGLSELALPKEMDAHSERWKPYRSAAAWYLWRAVDLQKKLKSQNAL